MRWPCWSWKHREEDNAKMAKRLVGGEGISGKVDRFSALESQFGASLRASEDMLSEVAGRVNKMESPNRSVSMR